MGYSRDPMNYDPQERALLLASLGEVIRIEFENASDAFNQRGRLYGLRKAVTIAYDKLQVLEKQGKATIGYDNEFIRAAPAIRSIGIRFGNPEKTIIVIGKGESLTPQRRSALGNAMQKYGVVSEEDREEGRALAAIERIQVELEPEADVPTLADLGFGTPAPKATAPIIAAVPDTKELTNDEIVAKYNRGEMLTPIEMRRLQEME